MNESSEIGSEDMRYETTVALVDPMKKTDSVVLVIDSGVIIDKSSDLVELNVNSFRVTVMEQVSDWKNPKNEKVKC